MSFMVVNALSYALRTVYHDIDTTTLVLDVLFFLILIYRKLHCIQKNVQIYISIYIPEQSKAF